MRSSLTPGPPCDICSTTFATRSKGAPGPHPAVATASPAATESSHETLKLFAVELRHRFPFSLEREGGRRPDEGGVQPVGLLALIGRCAAPSPGGRRDNR